MSVFLYYVPGKKISTREEVAAAGLAYLLDDDISPTPCGVNKGPGDNGAGAVLSFAPRGFTGELPPTGYYPDRQEWQKFGEMWVGVDKERPPTQAGIVRKKQMPGHTVKFSDGNNWLVPVARAVNGTTPFPQKMKWNGADWEPGDIMPNFKNLFSQACRFWDEVIGQDNSGENITISDGCDFAIAGLAVNYRVGPGEATIMGLLDTESVREVIKALIDWPVIVEFKKKQEAGQPLLTHGEKV